MIGTDNGRWMFNVAAWITVVSLLAMTVGCASASPRYVEAIDSTDDGVKFLYTQKTEEGVWERGIIECDLVDDAFEDCRHIETEFQRW